MHHGIWCAMGDVVQLGVLSLEMRMGTRGNGSATAMRGCGKISKWKHFGFRLKYFGIQEFGFFFDEKPKISIGTRHIL